MLGAGSLIGAGMKAGASIFGGIAASKAIKNIKNNINTARTENANWYNRRYNEDATQRADAQSLLTQTRDILRNQNQNAAAARAVMGGTDESVAQSKAAANDTLAKTISNIDSSAEASKNQIESQYRAQDNTYMNQLNNLEQQKANSISQAVNGVADAASSVSKI